MLNLDRIEPSFKFPDGQPHIDIGDAVSNGFQPVEIRCRVCDPVDLFNLAMAVEIVRNKRLKFNLRIVYLMGARMDRRLSQSEPCTLRAVAGIINSFGADCVSVFCPHSQATSDLIERYDDQYFCYQENDFYSKSIIDAIGNSTEDVSLVFPDAGAEKRFDKMKVSSDWPSHVVLSKHREERTGKILGIKIIDGTPKSHCVIVDDLCDGGRTFIEAAKPLRANGANKITLVVAHGVFSKGTPLEGIDQIFTTNSFYRGSDFGVYEII